jgi:hypothetical protein
LGNGENHGYKPLKYSTILKNNFKRDVFTREKNKGGIKLGVFFWRWRFSCREIPWESLVL